MIGIASIISILTVIGGVLIAYFRWKSSSSTSNKRRAKESERQAKQNADAAIDTTDDAARKLLDRAKRKFNNRKS